MNLQRKVHIWLGSHQSWPFKDWRVFSGLYYSSSNNPMPNVECKFYNFQLGFDLKAGGHLIYGMVLISIFLTVLLFYWANVTVLMGDIDTLGR